MRYTSEVSRVLLVLAVACSSDSPQTPIDAKSKIDAPQAACTGAVYDPCTDPSQCDSLTCHTFGSNFEICTQTCTPNDNATCPGSGATCNNIGICKPTAPNDCHR